MLERLFGVINRTKVLEKRNGGVGSFKSLWKWYFSIRGSLFVGKFLEVN